jgi:hypothetical protein
LGQNSPNLVTLLLAEAFWPQRKKKKRKKKTSFSPAVRF